MPDGATLIRPTLESIIWRPGKTLRVAIRQEFVLFDATDFVE